MPPRFSRSMASNIYAALARCFFDAGRSAPFASRPRRSARTAASSGLKLCTSARNSLARELLVASNSQSEPPVPQDIEVMLTGIRKTQTGKHARLQESCRR
jgi:hypothetical protein